MFCAVEHGIAKKIVTITIFNNRNAVAKLRHFPDGSVRLSSMDRNTLSALLNPLLRLRQSCCHPQVLLRVK